MYSGGICRTRHNTTKCIYLFNQMTFSNSANGRIAAHLTDGFYIVRQQQCAGARTTGRQRRLGTGMTATDNDDVVVVIFLHICRPGAVCQCVYQALNFKYGSNPRHHSEPAIVTLIACVLCQLLANTKATKNLAEQIIAAEFTGDQI
jgi:hypothetical protein